MESTVESGRGAGDRVAAARIIRDAVRICCGNPGKFLGAAALIGLPSFAATFLNLARDPKARMSPGQGLIGLLQLALLLASFVLVVYFIGAIPLVTARILDGRPAGWVDAFEWVRDRELFWGVFLAMFLDGLAVLGGLVLLIVPGLVFGTWFMLAVPARVLGDHPGRKALSVSRGLVAPVLFRGALSFACIIFLPAAAVGAVTQGVCSAMYGFMSNSPARVVPPAVATYLVGTLWGPVMGVALALLYVERAGGLAALRKDLFV